MVIYFEKTSVDVLSMGKICTIQHPITCYMRITHTIFDQYVKYVQRLQQQHQNIVN